MHSRHSFLGSFHGLVDLEARAEFPNIRGHSVARLKWGSLTLLHCTLLHWTKLYCCRTVLLYTAPSVIALVGILVAPPTGSRQGSDPPFYTSLQCTGPTVYNLQFTLYSLLFTWREKKRSVQRIQCRGVHSLQNTFYKVQFTVFPVQFTQPVLEDLKTVSSTLDWANIRMKIVPKYSSLVLLNSPNFFQNYPNFSIIFSTSPRLSQVIPSFPEFS